MLYRKRQEINKHIFGTIKRKWGYNHTNLKDRQKVNEEMALIITVYNIRRCIIIVGIPELITRIKNWTPDDRKILFSFFNTTSLKTFRTMESFDCKQNKKIELLIVGNPFLFFKYDFINDL